MKNLVLSKLGDYTLIARVREDNTVYEYVVAWCYNEETDSWAQGHYFRELSDAVFYMENKKMTKEQKRAKLVKMMHEYIRLEVDDEYAYMNWINLVPDEPKEEDFNDLAEDKNDWIDCVKLFGKLLKEFE